MKLIAAFALLLWTVVPQDRPGSSPADDLAAAKAMYAAGTYEEALARLPGVKADPTANESDQYRALCQLALGRSTDVQHTLEELIARSPLYKMSEADVPPRLVTMFHEVRKRQLPAIVRGAYAKGKSSYEQKDYTKASGQLKDVMQLLSDDDMADQAVALADLKELADGFLKLSDERIAAAARAEAAAAAAKPPAPPPVVTPPPAPAPVVDKIYTLEDHDVTPPVDVATSMPIWKPPNAAARQAEYRGAIRVVIDKTGKVETAALVQSAEVTYDALLLASAKQWTYKPATRNGEPVRFTKVIPVLLTPR